MPLGERHAAARPEPWAYIREFEPAEPRGSNGRRPSHLTVQIKERRWLDAPWDVRCQPHGPRLTLDAGVQAGSRRDKQSGGLFEAWTGGALRI